MKQIGLIILVVLFIGFNFGLLTQIALANTSGAQEAALQGLKETAGEAKLTEGELSTTLGAVIGVVLSFLGIILVIIVVYGGMLWMTAGGNPDSVSKARHMIIEGIIGLIICLSAYTLSRYVVDKISGAVG